MITFRNHEWFKKELPAYLFPSPTDNDASIIDMDAVSEVCEVFHSCHHFESKYIAIVMLEIRSHG